MCTVHVFHIHIKEFSSSYIYSYNFLHLFHVLPLREWQSKIKEWSVWQASTVVCGSRKSLTSRMQVRSKSCTDWLSDSAKSQRQTRHHFKICFRWLLWSNFSCWLYFDNVTTKDNALYHLIWKYPIHIITCEGGERKPARVFSVKPARKMISLWQSSKMKPDTFYTRHLLHQTTFSLNTFTTGTFYTKHLVHQTPFIPGTSSPDTFYTRHLLHQTPFTPGTFYTKQHRLHQTPFTPNNTVYTRHLFTRHISHQTPFTPDNFHNRQLLHQPTFTPVVYFYTNQLLHQTPFTPPNFHTCLILLHQPAFTPDTFYTNQLLHETPFTPTSFYNRHLLHQKPFHETSFTPDTLYTRHLLHEATFYTTHPFTPDTFYTRRLLHQTPFTPSTFYTTPGRQTRVDSSLWPQRTVPKLSSGTNGCQTLKTGTLNTSYFCQKRPLCQPPPSPTPPPYSHFVRKLKLRLAYRLAFVMPPSVNCKKKNTSTML